MRIDVTEDGELCICEVFDGAYIETIEGNRLGFCLRDDTVEMNVLPVSGGSRWFRVDMDTLAIDAMNDRPIMISAPSKPRDVNRYRKKPVVIEAFQFTKERRRDNSEWPNWLHDAWNKEVDELGSFFCNPGHTNDDVFVRTLSGVVDVRPGYWIVQGVAGELYPCEADIFEQTYEPESPDD